jgi:hypothetical protein
MGVPNSNKLIAGDVAAGAETGQGGVVMSIAWIDAVKRTGKLTVYVEPDVAKSAFGSVVDGAIKAFNTLSTHHDLGVKLAKSTAAPEDSGGGADVKVAVANGPISFTYDKVDHKVQLIGTRLHGRTSQIARQGLMEKAFVFLPANPLISSPAAVRGAGRNVKELILLHELVHATGLEDSDHGNDDLFQANPNVEAGDSPAQDKVVINFKGKSKYMPPYVLSDSTVNDIKGLWK